MIEKFLLLCKSFFIVVFLQINQGSKRMKESAGQEVQGVKKISPDSKVIKTF